MNDTPASLRPVIRPRRLRRTAALRDAIAEAHVRPASLVLPLFVTLGEGREDPVASLPGVSRRTVDLVLPLAERALRAGVRSLMLFGVVDDDGKDADGRLAADPDGPVPRALRALRGAFGDDLVLMSDVCLCGYTDHGHCGVRARGAPPAAELEIDNDRSLGRLSAMALAHAEAGVDLVSPSDMMDGRVAAIRAALDGAGAHGVGILSYAVKYASAFYGPFRDAAGSTPGGDVPRAGEGPRPPATRATYQMDARNAREALREAALDEAEGADMLMIKPALAYLDVLARVRDATMLPLVAYQVSGEYAMLKAAARAGVLDEARAVSETLTAIRRAGADLIVTYAALDAAERGWLG
ncbi:porphobilinogen synthase [soil metagenome]